MPMKWKKSSPELVARFEAALPKHPSAVPKKMFGYAACFVNGNYFAGLFQEQVILRLPGDLKSKYPELAKAEGFNPMGKGKPMKDWWIVPGSIAADQSRLASLCEAVFAEVQKLPAKQTKAKKLKG